ncbi:mycofactocin biosynthesis glycosyltransferase MftF [Tsukamurella sp. PLM1]|uniref:mycofactocin biosynthesis glycosyltransferase MftF n=1 Tax=Tsukamurella sp. PLM1 TaxID=2929795 RepID=UPI00200A6577|nr:mycofactocin biosynthesis glycosyltransferase MftF [Tsukamurella sp. PLM1]BDH55342.1 putative mycofactocin biosynthesis glycosyltransferase MftF [Tsukamurella sp. PLM1]
MTAPAERNLPEGFAIRIAPAVTRRGEHLVGGSPLRVLTLSRAAAAMIGPDGTLVVADDDTRRLARRLLDAGVADPVPPDPPPPPPSVTVVIPVRDNQSGVDRLLASLLADRPGLPVIVVDDGSPVPIRVGGAPSVRVLRLPRNVGPAAARNRGAGLADTELVAFLDSDTVPEPGWLARSAWHFADPGVALVAPRIVGLGRPSRLRPVAVYADRYSSLDMGPRPAAAAPGRPLAYVPSAALLARREALTGAGGFDESLRVAEDVDLCWRLAAAGRTVRYEPGARVGHEHRYGLRQLLGRRRFYGTGAAELARRHGAAAAPVVTTVPGAVATVGLLSRTRCGALVSAAVYAWMFVRLRRALRAVPAGDAVAARNVARAAWFGALQGWSALLRHHWPLAAAAALIVPRFRRPLLTAAIAEAAATWVAAVLAEPSARHPDPFTWAALHRLDDLAYGLGVWQGALTRRDPGALRPTLTRR